MLSGDNLSVSLFFISLAAALYIQTLRPEIRRVRIVMWITAAALFLIGIVWPFLGVVFPVFAESGFAASVVSLASNVWAWFILLMVMLLTGSILPALKGRKTGSGGYPSAVMMSSPPLQDNEIIFPSASKNGVLWRWVDGAGMSGPFCPVHGIRLYYWPNSASSRADFKEDDWLWGNASLVCPIDESEEFTFIRPPSMKIGQLRTQAADRFQRLKMRESKRLSLK